MLGERIFQLRRSRGLSQEQLAERIGVSRQTISKWEGGQSTPDLEKLIALSDCFELSLDALVRQEQLCKPGDRSSDAETVTAIDTGISIQRLAGLVLLLLGALGLVVTVVLLFLHPETMESLDGSFALTVDGSGVVYGLCILAIVTGVYLVIRKDQP